MSGGNGTKILARPRKGRIVDVSLVRVIVTVV